MKTNEIINIETLEEEVEIKKAPLTIINNPCVAHRNNDAMDIMRITLEDDFTKIDFVHYASKKYINGGWVQIAGNTFIRILGSTGRLTLLKAINITIAPNKHHYKSKHECLYFSLLFPSIPKSTTHIDIIEKEGGDSSFFNFYGVSMSRGSKSVIRILN